MDRASLATAIAGLALSLLVSAAAWVYFDSLLLFLFLPIVPFLFRRRARTTSDRPVGVGHGPDRARCPRCGFETTDPDHEFCPRDGTRLERDRP